MAPLIISACLGVVFFLAGGTYMFVATSGKKGKNLSGDLRNIEATVVKLDSLIDRAVKHCQSLAPLSSLEHFESKINELIENLKSEREKLAKLDKQVTNVQAAIEKEDKAHEELKKGKDEVMDKAEELRTAHQQLSQEAKHLEAELVDSLTKLDALSTEVTLTSEQQIAFEKICSALDNAKTLLSNLNDMHTQAILRFNNLEAQLRELEREYSKLLEKELGSM